MGMFSRFLRPAQLAVAVPALFVCTLPGMGGDVAPTTSPASIGGGPPGGIRGVFTRATPTEYGDCGPGGIRETGLQGQVPAADQASGASREGARCNLRLVGENDIRNRGANFQLGWYRNCAYVGSVGAREVQTAGGDELDGVAVVDVADPRNPQLATIVRAPSGVSQHEAVEVNEERGMLVVETGGLVAQYVDVYDVSQDCRNPVFKGRYDAGKPLFHGMVVSDDGRTVYATDFTGAGNATQEVMHVIDVSDMSNPTLLTKWDPTMENPAEIYGIHDLEISADGNRAYLGAVPPSAAQGALVAGPPSNTGPSMVVLDTSDIQARRPNPDPEVISEVAVPNFGHTEQRATIDGKPFVISSGETPFRGADNCPWAWGNLVDISDERNPKVVSELKLEVNEQDNCGTVGPDDAVYSIHYIGVDDEQDTKLVFYTYYTGGVRIFDVRDPKNPQEIGYFHPDPVESTVHPPTPLQAGDFQGPAGTPRRRTSVTSREDKQLWFASIGRGFQVLELTGRAAEIAGGDTSAKVRIPRQKQAKVLRKGKLKARARCSDDCDLALKLKLDGKTAGKRKLSLTADEPKRIAFKLRGRAERKLASDEKVRAKITGRIRDAATGEVLGKVKPKSRVL